VPRNATLAYFQEDRMLGEYSWLEFGFFFVFVIICLFVDLKVHKEDKPISPKDSLIWSIIWIVSAWLFAAYIGISHGGQGASLFLAAYLLEKSLSIDNLFVFMAVFSAFAIKDEFQFRVLFWGIVLAIILRMIFLAGGKTLIVLFGVYAMIAFGLFVLWTAWKMWQQMNKDEEEIVDYTNHWSVIWTRKIFPVHNKLDGHNFFVRIQEGSQLVRKATPLFLCLVVIGFVDIMFAFDSVPAVLAVTDDVFLIYTSNIFAVLGMRAMFFLLAAAKRFLCHLEKAVILILVYIGLKMLAVAVDMHVHHMLSLTIVGVLLTGGIVASLIWPPKKEEETTPNP